MILAAVKSPFRSGSLTFRESDIVTAQEFRGDFMSSMNQKFFAEAIGTFTRVAAVVGAAVVSNNPAGPRRGAFRGLHGHGLCGVGPISGGVLDKALGDAPITV